MGLPNPETGSKTTIRRGFLLGVVCVLIALLLGAGFFVAGQYSATCFAAGVGQKTNAVVAEKRIAEITDFYKCIISIQFAVIGVVLVVAFVYVHTASTQQARDMAAEALDSISFQRDIDHKFKELETKLRKGVKKQWIDVKNSSDLEEIRVSQKDLLKRVGFVEQVMDDYTSSDHHKTGLTLQEPGTKEGG